MAQVTFCNSHRHFIKVSMAVLFISLVLAGCKYGVLTLKPGSWTNQLRSAEQAATNIDQNALLIDIAASPIEYNLPSGTLKTRFRFVRPASGATIDVWIEDTSVNDTIKVDSAGGYIADLPLEQERRRMMEALAKVEISPAEALEVALPEADVFSKQYQGKVTPSVSLNLDKYIQETYSVSAVWDIIWIGPQSARLHILVNAQTGGILKKELLP